VISRWLMSRIMRSVFSYSAWVVVVFVSIVLCGGILGPFKGTIASTPTVDIVVMTLGTSIVSLCMLSVLIIVLGMAIFCVWVDRSSAGAKILWFLLFFSTAPFGSVVYFFCVYRKLVVASHEVVNA